MRPELITRVATPLVWLPVAHLIAWLPWVTVDSSGTTAFLVYLVVIGPVLGLMEWLGVRGLRGPRPVVHALWMVLLHGGYGLLALSTVGDYASWETPNSTLDRFRAGVAMSFLVAAVATIVAAWSISRQRRAGDIGQASA